MKFENCIKSKKSIIAIIVAILIAAAVIIPIALGLFNREDSGKGGVIPDLLPSTITLLENGSTKYKVVQPNEPTDLEEFAVSELISIFRESTGITLEVVSSASAGNNLSGRFLSVGNTALKSAAGVNTDNLISTGFAIKLKDNTLVMAGGGEFGTLYAVYEFLEKNLGYRYFASDEVLIPPHYNALFMEFDYTYQPPTEHSNISSVRVRNTPLEGRRYRTTNQPALKYWPHSHAYVLRPTEYPQFYKVPGRDILCLTDRAMWDAYVAKAIEIYKDDSDLVYYTVGAMDARGVCTCAGCKESDRLYTHAGTDMIFANHLATEVKKHFAEHDPLRDIRILTLAYYDTENPPVKTVNGVIMPIDEKVIPAENVYTQVCFLYQDSAASINDEDANGSTLTQLRGWRALSDRLFTYIYNGWQVHNNMLIFFDWEHKAETIKTLRDNDFKHIHWEIEGARVTQNIVSFQTMRSYFTSQLLWNPEQDTNALIFDFITNYYKDGAPFIQEYFDMINLNFKLAQIEYLSENKRLGQFVHMGMHRYLYDERVWPELMLETALELFDKAINAIETNDEYDNETREMLLVRLRKEQIFPRYYQLLIYKNSFASNDYALLAEQFNIDVADLGGSMFLKI